MGRITLDHEKETLLIPLYGKAKESMKKNPIIIDKKALEIVKQIDYDFSSLNIPEKTNMLMSIRAKLIDNFTKDYLTGSSESVVVHLGCGLDSRYERIQNPDVDWYDVDFKEVIDIRKLFFKETDNYHMLSSSVTEKGWLEELPEGKTVKIVIAEGLFMYLQEDDIKDLIKNLKHKLGSYILIFDAFNVYTAKKVGNHPSLKKTGAVIQWGIDNPEVLQEWGIEFIKEEYFTDNDEVQTLNPGIRVLLKVANLFTFVKKAHRLLIYEIR